MRGETLGASERNASSSVEGVTAAVVWGEGTYRYEWRFDVETVSQGQVRLRPDMVLGFDIALVDKDEDDSGTWISWSNGWSGGGDNVGDVVFLEDSASTAWLQGQVRRTDSAGGVGQALMEIRSQETTDLILQQRADMHGRFEVELLPGRYEVELIGPTLDKSAPQSVQLRANEHTEINLSMPPPSGRSVKAGRGRGHWQRLSVEHGLASNSVYDIIQSQAGDLWFATEGGVSRYDGERMVSFTTQAGSPVILYNLSTKTVRALCGLVPDIMASVVIMGKSGLILRLKTA
jgi:hypothetical protein